MKQLLSLFFALAFIFQLQAQDTLSREAKELLAISSHYKAISSLQIDVSYKVYADTLQNSLMDSSLEHFVSFNGITWTSHLNTVSIIGDTFTFHIDHSRRVAWLDKKPVQQQANLPLRVQELLGSGSGYARFEEKDGKLRYRIFKEGLAYHWIDIYTDPVNKKLEKIVYRFSDINTRMRGAKLMVIEFTNQQSGKKVDKSLFSLKKYLSSPGTAKAQLLPEYAQYRFNNYLY